MKKTILLLPVLLILLLASAKSDKPAYVIYTSNGREADFKDLVNASKDADIFLFGEIHNNPVCHWLELELTRDLYAVWGDHLVLGAEMFDAEDQLILNEYTEKFIRKKDFESEVRTWPNYKTDYAPLVDFASEKGIHFVGTSVPRRYAAIVNQCGFSGLDSINARERGLIVPLPVKFDSTLNSYREMKKMAAEEGAMHGSRYLAEAQALKDATMAHFLLKNWGPEYFFLHFNGSYHSDDHEGIAWYLKEFGKRQPKIPRVLTITCVEQDDVEKLSEKYLGKADFIIVIPSSMTKTY